VRTPPSLLCFLFKNSLMLSSTSTVLEPDEEESLTLVEESVEPGSNIDEGEDSEEIQGRGTGSHKSVDLDDSDVSTLTSSSEAVEDGECSSFFTFMYSQSR
jgi:hypothetical protein